MKLLILALSVALLFTAGEALNCLRCDPKNPWEACEQTVETCPPGKDACAAVVFISEPNIQYQECMKMTDCEMLKSNTFMDINCCTTDMCNHYNPIGK
ncbi:CD59 glycoprotein-like [Cheilinus undulatus]|uniref:CD59 glycoprotein-like n=1 Tax=Cheilinus undulatus TaxID=241271 RepID=UPI001BD3DF00|nr:CD59 glycoprotein-like [Cheilinus undulatus]